MDRLETMQMDAGIEGNNSRSRFNGAVMRMEWRHLLFMHWPVEPHVLKQRLPPVFEVDTFDARGWIGLVPFTMRDVSPIVCPRMPLRGVTDFHECNVRTNVRCGEELGVYFLSLDAASHLAVWGARRLFHLPYFYARMSLQREGDVVTYASDRADRADARLRCRWRAGKPLPRAQPGELAHFLTERYRLLTVDRAGRPCRCRIEHAPWPLREAALLALDDSLVAAAGIDLDPSSAPLLHHVDRLPVRASRLERIGA